MRRTAAPRSRAGHDANSTAIPTDYPPSRPKLIAARCSNMAHFKETGCAQEGEEPLWKACLGVMAFCENGDKVAHDWSSKDTRYNLQETGNKLAERKKLSGASLCKQFYGECGTASEARCEACSFFGKVAKGESPIGLGIDPNGFAPPVEPDPEVVPGSAETI